MKFSPKIVIKSLIENGISQKDAEKIASAVQKRYKDEPAPRIALMGLTGVGKSSTVNALFDAGQEIGEVLPCTKRPGIIHSSIDIFNGAKGPVTIYDMPGLGEDLRVEKDYLEEYIELVPEVDVAVWIIDAGDRAIAPIQRALKSLIKAHGDKIASKFIVAINKVDSTAPGELEWNRKMNVPGKAQIQNIEAFERYVREGISYILPGWPGTVVSYSARQRYRLAQLMQAMVEAVPTARRWVLNDRACLADYRDFIDPAYLPFIMEQMK